MKYLYLPHAYSQQRQREKKAWIYPWLLAAEATKRKEEEHEVYWEYGPSLLTGIKYDKIITEPEGLPFLSLPHPDRKFTNAFDEKYQKNGNFKFHPATYIQAANGCWHGRCTFCIEQKNKWEVRPVEDVFSEVHKCYELGFRELFDDSGTFPVGKWLENFCKAMCLYKLKTNRKIILGCNMRMVDVDYEMMKQAGFRMVLIGIESANEKTLEKINKGIKPENIIPFFKKVSKIGLDLHVSSMIGFPWETYKETMNTINLIKYLLVKGYAKTAQMSFYTPSPDQEQGNEKFRKYVNKFYEVGFDPRFWFRKIVDIKSIDDIKYIWKGIKKGLSWN